MKQNVNQLLTPCIMCKKPILGKRKCIKCKKIEYVPVEKRNLQQKKYDALRRMKKKIDTVDNRSFKELKQKYIQEIKKVYKNRIKILELEVEMVNVLKVQCKSKRKRQYIRQLEKLNYIVIVVIQKPVFFSQMKKYLERPPFYNGAVYVKKLVYGECKT